MNDQQFFNDWLACPADTQCYTQLSALYDERDGLIEALRVQGKSKDVDGINAFLTTLYKLETVGQQIWEIENA